MYIVPDDTMRFPLLLGRASWMHFHSRSYQMLPPELDGRIFGKTTLSHICDDTSSSSAAYIEAVRLQMLINTSSMMSNACPSITTQT